MALDYGSEIFTLLGGESVNITTIFNSNDLARGGDYVGPLVVAAAAGNLGYNRVLTPSTVSLEFTGPSGEVTSYCLYSYSIRNDSADTASFNMHFFHE